MADDSRPDVHPDDQYILDAVRGGGEWLRIILCTLARRGVAFRETEPERAAFLLEQLSTFPIYKGLQFLFDLMEWEDFMVDGISPAVRASALDERSVRRLSTLLAAVRQHLDGSESASLLQVISLGETGPVADEPLPPLEPGFFLYQDVVLGILRSIVQARGTGPA